MSEQQMAAPTGVLELDGEEIPVTISESNLSEEEKEALLNAEAEEEGPQPVGGEDANGEPAPHFTETQQTRFDKLTKEYTDLVAACDLLQSSYEAQEKYINTLPAGNKRTSAFKDMEKLRKRMATEGQRRDKIKNDLDTLRDAGLKKAAEAKAKEEAKAQKEKEKEETALAERFDTFEVRVLTDKERKRRDQLEKQAQAGFNKAGEGLLEAARAITAIKEEGLYVDHPGGMPQYVLDTFGISMTKKGINEQVLMAKGVDELLSIKLLPPRPEDGIDLKDFDPEKMSLRQVRELNRAGDTENKAKVLSAVIKTAEEKSVPITGEMIRAAVDAMKEGEELATGLDKYLEEKAEAAKPKEKKEKAPKEEAAPTGVAAEGKPTLLGYETYIQIAENFGKTYILFGELTPDGMRFRTGHTTDAGLLNALREHLSETEFVNANAAKGHLELIASADKSKWDKEHTWDDDPNSVAPSTNGSGQPTTEGASSGENHHDTTNTPSSNGTQYYLGVRDDGKVEVITRKPEDPDPETYDAYLSVEGPFGTQAEAQKRFKELRQSAKR